MEKLKIIALLEAQKTKKRGEVISRAVNAVLDEVITQLSEDVPLQQSVVNGKIVQHLDTITIPTTIEFTKAERFAILRGKKVLSTTKIYTLNAVCRVVDTEVNTTVEK